jgi:putative ABC transport system permease protein
LLPVVNNITSKNLALFNNDNYVTTYFLLGTIIIGILAGLFPALYLSSFKPIIVLKGIKINEKGVFNFRKTLVVTQFTISGALIAGSLIIYKQVDYMQSTKLGLNKDQVLIIRDYDNLSAAQKISFQNELLHLSGVKDAAASDGVIGGQNWTSTLNVKGSKDGAIVNFITVGYDFLDVLGIKIKEGRNFSSDFPADTLSYLSNKAIEQDRGSIIINEKGCKRSCCAISCSWSAITLRQ